MTKEVSLNNDVVEKIDPALWQDIEQIETEEHLWIKENSENEKCEALDSCAKGLTDLQKELQEPQEKEIVEEEEEEKAIEKVPSKITEWEIQSNWEILFFFDEKEFFIHPDSIQENGIWYSGEFHNIQNLTITTPQWNFVIQDGYVYNWSNSMEFYVNKIKDAMWEHSSYSKYHDILQGWQGKSLTSINFKNYQKNIYILNSILDLELSKNTLDENEKSELLIGSAENLNLTYEIDKIYIEDLKDSELLEVVQERLSWILDKGVYIC